MLKHQVTRHASKIPHEFHETTDNRLIKEYSTRAMRALETKGHIDGISEILKHSPNDWFGIPKVTNENDIRLWMRMV